MFTSCYYNRSFQLVYSTMYIWTEIFWIKILIFHCFSEPQTVTVIWMKKKIIIPSIHRLSQEMNWIQS